VVGNLCLPKFLAAAAQLKKESKSKPGFVRYLAFPSGGHSLETIVGEITAITTAPGEAKQSSEEKESVEKTPQLWMTSGRKDVVLRAPFYGVDKKTREEAFGKITDMRRFDLPHGASRMVGGGASWRGVIFSPTTAEAKAKLLLFDGDGLAFAVFDTQTVQPLFAHSLIWDMLRPPADRGGEGTAVETAKLRAKLKKMVQKTRLKVTGIVPLPPEVNPEKSLGKTTMALATRIPGFPLMLAECDTKNLSQCVLTRQCYLEGAPDLPADAVSGIAVSAARKLIIIGDRKAGRLLGFKISSCYNVQRVAEWFLPDRIKKLSNIYIDSEDRLWLTSSEPDNYLNASVYVWKALEW
jgi:hypothetical protein